MQRSSHAHANINIFFQMFISDIKRVRVNRVYCCYLVFIKRNRDNIIYEVCGILSFWFNKGIASICIIGSNCEAMISYAFNNGCIIFGVFIISRIYINQLFVDQNVVKCVLRYFQQIQMQHIHYKYYYN